MSKIYVVSYDFKYFKDRYYSLFEELKRFPAWWHFLDGTWLISTDLDAQALFQKLRPHLDEEANLLVVEAGEEFAGWLPKKAWEWINLHRRRAASKDALSARG